MAFGIQGAPNLESVEGAESTRFVALLIALTFLATIDPFQLLTPVSDSSTGRNSVEYVQKLIRISCSIFNHEQKIDDKEYQTQPEVRNTIKLKT